MVVSEEPQKSSVSTAALVLGSSQHYCKAFPLSPIVTATRYLSKDVTHLEDSVERVQVAALTLHNGAQDETSDHLKEEVRNSNIPISESKKHYWVEVVPIYNIVGCKYNLIKINK